MTPGLSLGRKDPAGRRRETEESTSSALVPERPAAPKRKTTNKRRSMFFEWLCFPCMRGAKKVASPSPGEEEKEEEEEEEDNNEGSQIPINKQVKHDKRATTHFPKSFSDPHPRRCNMEAFLKKLLLQERLNQSDEIKKEALNQAAEEGEAIEQDDVVGEEETAGQKGESSRSSRWWLSCCCFLAFLLLLAVFASTYGTIEEVQSSLPQEQLWVEMGMAALVVVTAVWSLYAFPTPGCGISYEAQVLMLLTFVNLCLVLVVQAVLPVNTSLGYWCWWLVAILVPFLLLVILCSLVIMAT